MKSRKAVWFWRTLIVLAGIGYTVFLLWPVGQWVEVQSWVETPAQLRSASLDRHEVRNGKTGVTTRIYYRVVARYNYQYEGNRYSGSRVLLMSQSPFDKTDHQKHGELNQLLRAGGETVCYVDPTDPGRVILDRRFRYEDPMLYLPVGALLFAGLLPAWQQLGATPYGVDAARQAKHPDEPWRWNRDWESRLLPSQSRSGIAVTLFVGLIVGGFSGVFGSMQLALGHKSGAALTIVNGLLALAVLVWAVALVRKVWRYLKYDPSTFQMAGPSGVIGGRLVGTLLGPKALQEADRVALRLYGVLTQKVKHGGKSRLSERIVWEREQPVTADRDGTRVAVPVNFVIPSDAPPSSFDAERRVTWRLSAEAEMSGIDYKEVFVVPVFETDESQPGVVAEAPVEERPPTDRTATLDDLLAAEGIRVEPLSGRRVRYVAPAGRSWRHAVSIACFAAFYDGVLAGIAYAVYANCDGWTWFEWTVCAALLAATSVFWLAGLLMPLGVLESFLHCEDLTVEPDRWTARVGWWALPKWRTEMPASTIRNVLVHQHQGSSIRVGHEKERTRHVAYDVQAVCSDRSKPVTLVRRVKNKHTAERLAEALIDRLTK